MLDVFVVMQVEAGEARRMADYHTKGSGPWLEYISLAEELEDKVRVGIEAMKEIFGHYGQAPGEQKKHATDCSCKEKEESKSQCESGGCKNGCRC